MRLGKSNTGTPRVRMENEVGEEKHWSTPSQERRLGWGRETLVDPVPGRRMRLGKRNTCGPRVRKEDEVWQV